MAQWIAEVRAMRRVASVSVNEELKSFVQRSLSEGWHAFRNGDVHLAWQKFSDAHIYSQPMAIEHTRVHFEMLRLALRTVNLREVTGQAIRLILAAPGSLSGRYPVGNTGRSDVNMFMPMELPSQIRNVLNGLSKPTDASSKSEH